MKDQHFVDNRNPYLQDNFAPVADVLTVDKLTINGNLPQDFNGLYVRNGPNPQLPLKGAFICIDAQSQSSELLVIDAKTIDAEPVARVLFESQPRKANSLFLPAHALVGYKVYES